MFFKKSDLASRGARGRGFNPMYLHVPQQQYYQNGHLNEFGYNNGGYMYGDFSNHNRFQNPQVSHWQEPVYNPYVNHHAEAYSMYGNKNGEHDPNLENTYQNGFSKMENPHYFGNGKDNNHSNIVGNPLIHEEVSYVQQGNTNQFSSEPFAGFQAEKNMKKQGAFKSVMNQFKSDNGSIDFKYIDSKIHFW